MSNGTRPCELCGSEFPIGPRERNPRKWCSEACRLRQYRERGRPRDVRRKTSCAVYVEPCDVCGELKTWRYRRRKSRLCSRACENVVKARRAEQTYYADLDAARARSSAMRRQSASPCQRCGALCGAGAEICFVCQCREISALGTAARRRKMFARAWRLWRDSQAAPPLMIAAAPPAGAPPRPTPPRSFFAGYCAACSSPFVSTYRRTRYCSSRCSNDSGSWIPLGSRHAIYDRDSWVCQLCNLPVPRVVTHLHPFGASLDHVLPRSHGGGHEPENLRLVHRVCNSIRSDETYPDWRSRLPTRLTLGSDMDAGTSSRHGRF